MTTSGPRRRGRKARLPEFPPDNELPASLDAGPFIWRSADAGIAVTGFLVYSTGVAFTLVALSKGASLQDEDPVAESSLEPFPRDRPAGALRFGAQGVPVTVHNGGGHENRLEIDAWAPFPPDGDLVFYLEWPAEGIGHSEFRVPRSAAANAVVLWPPGLLRERRRRHDELTPGFLVHVEPWAEGTGLMRLRVVQEGPPGIDHLDSLVLRICNDDSYWPDERNVTANGHNYQEIRNQVWGAVPVHAGNRPRPGPGRSPRTGDCLRGAAPGRRGIGVSA